MSKNVTTYECEQGTLLKSYDTFVALKGKDREKDMVTLKWHSKTTSRHINEFFGGKEYTNEAAKVSQSLLDDMGKFIEAYNNG
tara:strand:+ start:462 stop:710 length:249 start_codon:yes stop_codon:yes gene_type:complete